MIKDKKLVITCGLPAAGKSSIVEKWVDYKCTLLSRDIEGGTLSSLNKKLENLMIDGVDIILDGTYSTKLSRADAIALAKKYGYYVLCLYFTTKIEDCMFNAVTRMIKTQGRLFTNLSDYSKVNDPHMFPVAALYKINKHFEAPELSEGIDDIEKIDFKRKPSEYTNKAILFDYDGTLRVTKSGGHFPTDVNDIEIIPGRTEKLLELQKQGYILLGVSNQSGIAKGLLTHETAIACFEKTNEMLGVNIDYKYCGHSVPPIICYCRKPGVGLGVDFIEKYKLDSSQCTMVGDLTSDKTFAKRCGFKYVDASNFF